jgi:hypothetical protein
MKSSTLILYSSMALLFSIPGFGGAGKEPGMAYPVQYQGGSLPFKQSHAVSAVLANTEVVFIQHGQRFVVPVPDIREISCGTSVRRRFGAAVLRLVPLVDLDKVEDRYVAVTWTDSTRKADREILLKLNHGEYRDFVAVLERLTGKKAVNTNQTPTAVRYGL